MEAQRAVDRVTEAVREREDELVVRMLERFAEDVPDSGVGQDPDMTTAVRLSCYGNLHAALTQLARGGPPLPSGPPAEAIQAARTSVQADVPLDVLLQTYRVGQAVCWDAMLDAVNAMSELDSQTRSDALRFCTQYLFAYVDAVMPFVADEYTRERDRLLRGREQRRVQLIRDLLDGGDVDAGDLGYDLNAVHRGVAAWGTGADAELARLAEALHAHPLVVAVSGQTVWGWLAGGAASDDRALRAAIGEWAGGIAFGRAATGPDGFRHSHRQARAAHRIGVATNASVTHFDDVELECLLLADERAARAFVASQLAPLDAGRDGLKLRETLDAYFACAFNASAAAAKLKVNDRTIAYRLNNIEQLLGRSVRTRQTELQAAIRLERILGNTPQSSL
jgi:diguanylate cyclase with GGDEF domain/PucR-like helix-turn-helix protein